MRSSISSIFLLSDGSVVWDGVEVMRLHASASQGAGVQTLHSSLLRVLCFNANQLLSYSKDLRHQNKHARLNRPLSCSILVPVPAQPIL
jgi:hypothetical protein